MRRFWNWVKNEDGERTLFLEGAIAEQTWWGDEITPKMFKDDLEAGSGDIIVWINSPGGDIVAAAQIYNMLMEYPGQVTVKIDGMAASAASVVAMAGSTVQMSPVSMMMVHNPSTFAIGDAEEMRRATEMLNEFKNSIINAYEVKTSLSRTRLSDLLDAETWMNAHKAVELGFADSILYNGGESPQPMASADAGRGMVFSRMAVTNSLMDKITVQKPQSQTKPQGISTPPHATSRAGTPVETLDKRLSLISH